MLQEDREKLRALRSSQPRFTARQGRELQDAHPWLRAGRLPAALDLAVSSAPLAALCWGPCLLPCRCPAGLKPLQPKTVWS